MDFLNNPVKTARFFVFMEYTPTQVEDLLIDRFNLSAAAAKRIVTEEVEAYEQNERTDQRRFAKDQLAVASEHDLSVSTWDGGAGHERP